MLSSIKKFILCVVVSFSVLSFSACNDVENTNDIDVSELTNKESQMLDSSIVTNTTNEVTQESITEEITTFLNSIDQSTTKPSTTKPSTTKPSTTKPSAAKPSTSMPSTTKPKVVQTTNVDSAKRWFVSQYNIAKQQYINEISNLISAKQSEADGLREQISICSAEYRNEVNRIKEECANMGLSNSGTQTSMLKNAELKYQTQVKAYNDRITQINSEVKTLKAEASNPSVDEILAIVSKNCGITSKEAYEYYYLFVE